MAGWSQIGRVLVAMGIGIVLLGGLLILGSKLLGGEGTSWLGRLPGDIRIERKGFSCTVPLASSILISLVLTLLLNLVVRLLRRQ